MCRVVLQTVLYWLCAQSVQVHQVQAQYNDRNTHRNVAYQHSAHNQSEGNGCHGVLSTPCMCTALDVTCVNAQFTTSDIFLNIDSKFRFISSVTFKGNNFGRLPAAIFGPGTKHDRLRMLNLSSNYFVSVDGQALMHMPNLQTLDIQDNEIIFTGNESRFLTHTPQLRNLYLRKAFNPNVNKSHLLFHLEQMFVTARLTELRVLDLSYNGLQELPYQLGCHFPKLEKLLLSVNQLRTLHLNGSCFPHLDTLDVTFNLFSQMALQFRMTAAALPDYSLLAQHNRFLCDCNSRSYINFVKTTNKMQDRDKLLCWKASPQEFDGQLLTQVPVDKLDCDKNLTSSVPWSQTRYVGSAWSPFWCLTVGLLGSYFLD